MLVRSGKFTSNDFAPHRWGTNYGQIISTYVNKTDTESILLFGMISNSPTLHSRSGVSNASTLILGFRFVVKFIFTVFVIFQNMSKIY